MNVIQHALHVSSLGLPLLSPFSWPMKNGDIQRPAKRRHVQGMLDETDPLTALIQPAYLARVTSWLAFVVAILMGHENGKNKGQPRDDASKACWLNKSQCVRMPSDARTMSAGNFEFRQSSQEIHYL